MTLPEIDLPKLAGAAGSAVGLIISTAILLSWITARYVPTVDRFRSLTGELRGSGDQNRRRELLREQIHDLRKRLMSMSRATGLLCWGMWFAIGTIVAAGAALVWKENATLAAVGGVCLFAGLTLDAVAIGFMLSENMIDRKTIWAEAGDMDEVNGG